MITLQEIRGQITEKFSLEELEARLRPPTPEQLADRRTPGYLMRVMQRLQRPWDDISTGGFLAPHERLMDVIEADYHTLHNLNKSYEEMAEIAAKFLAVCSEWSLQYTRGSVTEGYLINGQGKKFPLDGRMTAGFQTCPWSCKEDKRGYKLGSYYHVYVREERLEVQDLFKQWCSTVDAAYEEGRERERRGENNGGKYERFMRQIEDRARTFGITFGGEDRMNYLCAFTVVTDLTPHLIASHHFFQGDASFRTDPAKLLQIFQMEFMSNGKG